MFEKILIANRGEIALRIQRACRDMGIKTVVVHSEADSEAKYVKLADESVCIGPAASSASYLNIPAIISAAEVTNAEAIHPGYGFLAENPDFAERVDKSGFVFIGPQAETIRLLGDKVNAKQVMEKAGVPCVPGSDGPLPDGPEEALKIARKIGYPVIVKAAGGGGSRGGLRQRHRLSRKVPREPATHRGAGARRRAQERGLSRRTRLLHAATAPEDHGGSPGARAYVEAARAHRRALHRGLPQDRLSRGWHFRVSLRGR